MTPENKKILLQLLHQHKESGISNQIDYDKFYLYSLITHSTAIEGSTVTEIENQLLFDEGISAKGRSTQEQLMNLDLKKAYEESIRQAKARKDLSTDMLQELCAIVMKNTGSTYNTLQGSFDSSKGDLRLVNVTAGSGGRSYMNFLKVPNRLADFCINMNERRMALHQTEDIIEQYLLSFDAHYELVTIHPWVDGNGRMSRLIMNRIQFEYGLVPTKVNKDDKADYIQALVDSREQNSTEPFREFMLREHIKNLQHEIATYRESIEEVDTNNVTRNVISLSPVHLTKRQRDIIKLINENELISAAEMSQVLSVVVRTIRRDLAVMQKRGIIARIGNTSAGKWIVLDYRDGNSDSQERYNI